MGKNPALKFLDKFGPDDFEVCEMSRSAIMCIVAAGCLFVVSLIVCTGSTALDDDDQGLAGRCTNRRSGSGRRVKITTPYL